MNSTLYAASSDPKVINIDSYRTPQNIINIAALKQNNSRRLSASLISPAAEDTSYEVAPEHDAEPIKSMSDIFRISRFLIDSGRYRDNMLFIVGINFGLRISDLRVLRFSNLINDNLTFKDRFPVFEKKTRNTRARKKNRYITINTAVIEAVTLYLENTPGVCLSDYMFRSESNHGGNKNEPLNTVSVNRILKGIKDDLGLNIRFSSHSFRKTFGYHQMVMSGNDPRKLLLLQKMFNHSSPLQTLTYIGTTADEIDEAYRQLNLGSVNYNYLVNSNVIELDDVAV